MSPASVQFAVACSSQMSKTPRRGRSTAFERLGEEGGMATTVGGPAGRLSTIQDALTPREWGRVGAMAGIVIGLNVLGWAMLAAATGHHYHLSKTDVFGLGTGVLAYTLGMRHAFDADHISAIDNTTRKLMADGNRPLSVGFFFSPGHSTIVFLLAVLLNFGIRDLDNQVKSGSSGLHQWTTVVGTSVSGFFLYLIAGLNIVILISIDRKSTRLNFSHLVIS